MTALQHISTNRRWVEGWRSFKMAAWLGWQIESNWADPLLFFIYSVVKPLASTAILVVMYGIITNSNFSDPLFPYIYLGNAFYMYVGAVMGGVSWAVIDDREHYKTLKYLYVAPIRIPAYLLGRGVARFLTGSLSVLITVLAGVLFLKIPINPLQANWPLFLLSLLIGVVMLAMMGLLLGSVTLLLVHHSWGIAEGLAGALYLFSGAIFPLDVLPAWLRPVGFLMPITYWLELLRRSLVGDIAQAFPTLVGFSNLELLAILIGLTLIFGCISVFVFRWCDHQARERGTIDMTSHY
ncbi:MAG: ABC transporter permease [Chloroflexota bacterium]